MIGVCLKLSANFRSVFLVRVAQRPDTSDSTEKKPAPPSGPFLKTSLFLGEKNITCFSHKCFMGTRIFYCEFF